MCMMCINFFNLAFLFTLGGAGKIRVNTTDDQFVLDFREVVGNIYALCSSETFSMAYHGKEWKRAISSKYPG